MGNEFKSISSQDGSCAVDVGEYAEPYKIKFKVGGVERGTIDDTGLFEIDNIACRGLFRTTAFETDTISVVGGSVMVRPGDTLADDMTALDSATMLISGNETFIVGDILRIKDGVNDEFFEVTNAVAAPIYSVTRDKAGSYSADANPTWEKGAAVVNYGVSGKGGILLTSSLPHAPYMSVFTHAGDPWTSVDEKVRVGNLNGYLGYTSDIYGVGIGSISSGEANLTFDPTNGIRFRQGTTNLFTIDMASSALLQQIVLQDLQAGSDIHGQYITDATITGGKIENATITGDHIDTATISGSNINSATITSDHIVNGTIVGGDIDSATITGGNIASAVITSDHIVNGTITSTDIANATIMGYKIANATIAGSNIVNGTITATNIASATITGGKIANATITGSNIGSATITSGNILNATITGGKIASATITGGNIDTLTITSGNIANSTITSGKIASNTITGGNIASNTITGGNIAGFTITAGLIQDLTITASQIANLTITGGSGGKIATSTISEDNIVANTITAVSIAAGAITTSELAADSVTSAKIVAGTIVASDIAADTITSSEINTTSAFIGMTIQSTVFTTGVTGWQINNNGDVEFNSGTFRGTTTWTGNSIGTSYTAAKCTDANADQTSTHTAANASAYTGASIATGYTAAKCTDANADQTSTHTAADITGQGALATEDDLDGVPNGTTYSRVLTTAISAGKIVLSSAGVTGTLPTSLTIAKCTDANADQTSANGQNLGWLVGSTGTLTISSAGKLSINTADALEITANGNVKVLAGGDIIMTPSASSASIIDFTNIGKIGASSVASVGLCIWDSAANTHTFSIGKTPSNILSRFKYINMYVKDFINLETYYSSGVFAKIKAFADSSQSYTILEANRYASNLKIELRQTSTLKYFGPYDLHNTIDLGRNGTAWKDIYAGSAFKGPLANSGAYIQCRSANKISFNWTGTQLDFYVDSSNVKTFVINHPNKSEKYLVHGTLEGPEACVFYRGTQKLIDGYAEVLLPDYFEALTSVEGRTIILTMIDKFDKMMIEKQEGEKIKDGMFKVKSDNPYSDQEFDWEVKAVRKDVARLVTEPLKSKTQVKGIGPYTYI